MSENPNKRQDELSFKEQILRDLEALKADLPTIQEEEEVSESVSELEARLEAQFKKAEAEIFSQAQFRRGASDLVQDEVVPTATNPAHPNIDEAPPVVTVKRPIPVREGSFSVPVNFGTTSKAEEATDFSAEGIFAQAPSGKPDLTREDVTPVATPVVDEVDIEPDEAYPSRTRRQQRKVVKKEKKVKPARRIVTIITVVLFLLIVLTGGAGYVFWNSSLEAVNPSSKDTVEVTIPEGSSTQDIANLLYKAGLIKNATVFTYHARFNNYDNFQVGVYKLSQSMTADEIAKALQETGSETVSGKIIIPEGYTLTQIAEAVAINAAGKNGKSASPFTADEFMKVVQDTAFIDEMIAKYPKLLASLPTLDSGVKYRLEGYLFPATYDYAESTTVKDLADQMLAAMDKALSPYYDQIASQGHTVNEILSLASLVEKEGQSDEDRKNIASVFYNRLNAGIPLQSNIAILYATDKLGQKTTLAEDAAIDTNIDSPYNIYTRTGLTPGPVDSPSLSAIQAVVAPNTTNYYYFVADVTTGTVYYAETYDAHQANVETYVNSKINTNN